VIALARSLRVSVRMFYVGLRQTNIQNVHRFGQRHQHDITRIIEVL